MTKSTRGKTLNTKLFVRILPSTNFHYDSIKIETNRQVLYIRCLQDFSKGVKTKNPNYWYFCTDGVFWNSCQSEVYEAVTEGLYDNLFDGVRAIIICYGQTGAGKSFTTSGLRYPFQKRGLILRILSQLFEEKQEKRDVTKICLGMSYLEFNGQIIRDLICDKKINSVKDVVEYKIPNEAWAWTQIFKAETRKAVNESAPYAGSNRGQSVLSFYIHSESLIDSDPVVSHSKIHIVDMGGIDNVGSKQSEWRSKIDICNSNLAKSLMEQLILYFAGNSWKNEKLICPYKTNRLLLYLHDTLNDKCLLRFVAHVCGDEENIPITLSALRFGEKIRLMRPTKLERVYETTRELEMRNLQKEYLRLKSEVTLNNLFNDSPSYANISQERIQEIKRAAEGFLIGQLEDLTIFSFGQAQITLKVFRELYQKLVKEKEQFMKDAVAAATEIIQAQLAAEKNATSTTVLALSSQKVSRKKSRQGGESQTSFGVSNRSSESAQNLGKGSVALQAGTTDRKGIGIGPPKKTPNNFEGNITKAFKKLKSKKSESVVLKGMKSGTTREFGAHPSKCHATDDGSRSSVIIELPPRETAWQLFLNDKVDVIGDLSRQIEAFEETAKDSKRNYINTLNELSRLREEIEECKTLLENYHHIREVYGKEVEDEKIPTEEFEENLKEVIANKEACLNAAIENCHVALIDYRHAAEELSELKRNLDDLFNGFCTERYRTTYPTLHFNESFVKCPESDKEVGPEMDAKEEARMKLYIQLQQKFLNDEPKNGKTKRKSWVNIF